jgi:hypothetical protein
MKTHLCSYCHTEKSVESFYKSKEKGIGNYCKPCINIYSKKWELEHPERRRASYKRYRVKHRGKRKLEVLKHYSNQEVPSCEICGFSDIRALSLDHINGGGNKHREEIRKGGTSFYDWVIKNNYPSGLRVLCMNCQFITLSEKRNPVEPPCGIISLHNPLKSHLLF